MGQLSSDFVADLKYVIESLVQGAVFEISRFPYSFRKDLVLFELCRGIANMADE